MIRVTAVKSYSSTVTVGHMINQRGLQVIDVSSHAHIYIQCSDILFRKSIYINFMSGTNCDLTF